ncbi:hypothetical protein [Dyadobacter sp. Leaf189]|uniref:hypothetical protein n=1 Tax=Dyadobacter sp. Leaf189 TaxID=1736295 RepID=UPI0006FDB393|nr:hypothetical protein [Dyadobacter sp. Leaf189]KQS32924.1 hypothetical protein ASG33_02180 [Dyadobacter sp. Leaf189]
MQKLNSTILSFAVVALLLAAGTPAHAQRPSQHEVQLSYGPLARERLLDDALIIFLGSVFSEPLPQMDFSSSFAITYRYQVTRRFAIGVTSATSNGTSYKADYYDYQRAYKHTNLIMAFEPKITYADTPDVTLYAAAGIGGLFVRLKDQRLATDAKLYAVPTFQVTPFGIRVGKKVGGFAEIGYGYKGLVSFGINTRF